MTETEKWLLREPMISLTLGEREWFEWATAGAKDILEDDAWLADNDDALTVSGQLLDLRYRLETQGHDMTEHLSDSERRAGRRTLNALNAKLEAAGYWNEEFHK